MKVGKVLYPTDFSEASHHALPHAEELVRRYGAELVMIHVRTPYSDDPNREEYHFFDEGKYRDFIHAELRRVSGNVQLDQPAAAVVHRNVSPASGILEFADEERVDLIVMGTHGRSALGRFFLGSVTERVVRYAKVPVLTVAPERETYRDEPSYRKILAAYDFSKHSKDACLRALDLAEKYRAQLEVLYVIEQDVHPGYLQDWKLSVEEEIPDLETEARQSLLEVLGAHGIEDVIVHVIMGDGDGRVHRDINRFARENSADLLVMGTYGLSGFEHLLLGSTTERVLRSAPCPVLVFHRGDNA